MPYYPQMAYRMVSLEPPLTPPTGLPVGLGDLPRTAWCSTTNRQGSCNPITGVCLPMDATTLATFKDLQRQTNRLLTRAGKRTIGVDGRIGPSTVNAVADAMSWAGAMGLSAGALAQGLSWSSIRGKPCDLIAAHADQIAAKIAVIAGGLAAPVVADPPSSKPSQPSTGGQVVHPPASTIMSSASTSFLSWLPPVVSTPLGIVALGVGGLLAYKAWKMPKGRGGGGAARGGRKSRRARPSRRRRTLRRRR